MYVPARTRQRHWVHALLLLLTFLSTLTVGARMQFDFQHGAPAFSSSVPVTTAWADFWNNVFPVAWAFAEPRRLLLGIPFSFTLMLILLCHEMGHYFYCVKYRVAATLPFFIPAPTPIGTLGAFIRIKSPMRSRRALFDIGIAGPIAGFVVAVAVLGWSLLLSRPNTSAAESMLQFGDYSLIFRMMHRLLLGGGAGYVPLERMLLHPTAIAAWVGMLATALNLLPGGQLDGGHILYSISPKLHFWVSKFTVIVLLIIGLFYWRGWLLWAVLLMLSGMRHPQIGPGYRSLLGYGTNGTNAPAPETGLGGARIALAVFALVMLVLTFSYMPIQDDGIVHVPQRHVARR